MTPTTYTKGQTPRCPSCGKDLENPVEDFTIPGRIGQASAVTDLCGWCDAEFTVEQTDASTFTLTA